MAHFTDSVTELLVNVIILATLQFTLTERMIPTREADCDRRLGSRVETFETCVPSVHPLFEHTDRNYKQRSIYDENIIFDKPGADYYRVSIGRHHCQTDVHG